MPAVVPSLHEGLVAQKVPGRVFGVCAKATKSISSFTGRLPGQYTVSKLDSFERFRQETSWWKVAFILILTPLPLLVMNLLLECIPLNEPAAGFWGSGYYQLRMFFTAICSSIAPAVVKLNCVPGFPVNSPRALIVYGLFQAGVCFSTNAIISLAVSIFPVPFSQYTVIVPMVVLGRLMFYRKLPDDPQFHALSDKVNQWLGMETLPILVYPVFTAIFMTLTSTQQLWMSLLLPVIKLAVRRALWAVAKDDHDLLGVITCCVGHLYHILFTAVILQNSKSFKTLAVVVVFNTGQMMFNCRYILADSQNIGDTRRKVEETMLDATSSDNSCVALTFTQELRITQILHWRTPSLFLSTYEGYHNEAFMERHEDLLRAASKYNTALKVSSKKIIAARGPHRTIAVQIATAMVRKPSGPRTSLGFSRIHSQHSIQSTSRSNSTPTAWKNGAKGGDQMVKREAVIHQICSALHQTEMILLRSYVTICMTLFYAIYLLVVFHLKNRQYFATLLVLTTREAVSIAVRRLLILCALEIIFLGIYLVLIWRNLGLSGIYQLAFVLFSQRVLVQAKFYLTIIILGFPLTHNGNDSILRFDSLE